MKNWIKWGVIGVLIILIIVGIILGCKLYSERIRLNEHNIYSYNILNCISECPIEMSDYNYTVIARNCSIYCQDEFKEPDFPGELQMKYQEKLLIASREVSDCLQKLGVFGGETIDFQNCLKETLPELKEKYNIKI